MAKYFARIVRALIVSVLGFGGGVGLFTFIVILVSTGHQAAITIGVRAALVVGLCFGVILALVLLLTDLTARLFLSQGRYKQIWELEQTRELDFSGNSKDLKSHCRQALLAVPNVRVVTEDGELSMTATIGTSWRSAGENMTVRLTPTAEDRFHLTCTSRPLASNIAFDYAKNFENVESWHKEILALINGVKRS